MRWDSHHFTLYTARCCMCAGVKYHHVQMIRTYSGWEIQEAYTKWHVHMIHNVTTSLPADSQELAGLLCGQRQSILWLEDLLSGFEGCSLPARLCAIF